MSQDLEPLVLWKHEPGSRTFGPLKTWAKAQKSLVLWKHEPGSVVLQVSISCTHSKKTKKKLHAWTTFGPDPPTKRYVGNLPQDSVHILIHNMTICIFIYIHSPQLNTDCKVRCLFHTLTFAFQALPMGGILLTPHFTTRI